MLSYHRACRLGIWYYTHLDSCGMIGLTFTTVVLVEVLNRATVDESWRDLSTDWYAKQRFLLTSRGLCLWIVCDLPKPTATYLRWSRRLTKLCDVDLGWFAYDDARLRWSALYCGHCMKAYIFLWFEGPAVIKKGLTSTTCRKIRVWLCLETDASDLNPWRRSWRQLLCFLREPRWISMVTATR